MSMKGGIVLITIRNEDIAQEFLYLQAVLLHITICIAYVVLNVSYFYTFEPIVCLLIL